MLCCLLQARNRLNRRGAGPNDGYCLVFPVHVCFPVGGVKEFAREVVQAIDLGPLPVVQEACAIDDDVCPVLDSLAADIDFDVPDSFGVIPGCALDCGVELDVWSQFILVGKVFEILPDLRCVRIKGRPIRIRLERECVCVCWDITCACIICQLLTESTGAPCKDVHPGYLFSYQVPPTEGFLSQTNQSCEPHSVGEACLTFHSRPAHSQ